jgi:hypothetical protein
MKKHFLAVFVIVVLGMGSFQSLTAQKVYVNVRPHASIVVRTPAPSRSHVWIGDEWTVRGGKYENVPQHWETPPSNRRHWAPGQWRKENGHGNYWVKGHWY